MERLCRWSWINYIRGQYVLLTLSRYGWDQMSVGCTSSLSPLPPSSNLRLLFRVPGVKLERKTIPRDERKNLNETRPRISSLTRL